MSLDPSLFRDPVQVAAVLSELESKDESECSYPTCHSPRQTSTGTGRPSAYCSNPKHNAVTSHRARQQLRAAAIETRSNAITKPETSSAPVTAPVESLRSSVLGRITLLQGDLERYVTLLTQISDPDVSAAQIQAALAQANARVAEAQQHVSVEQALRLKAEHDLLIAQEEALSEREAAEQAIAHMEEVETNAQHQLKEAEQHITEIQTERDTTVEQVHVKAQQRIQEIEQQTKRDVALAQTEMTTAQEEARQAKTAALEARAQVTTAERLVSEAHASLARERAEIDRLRKELAETVADARKRAETDRVEAQMALERERSERDRLREDLALVRKQAEQATVRADKLATANDELREQLIQSQMRQRAQTQQ